MKNPIPETVEEEKILKKQIPSQSSVKTQTNNGKFLSMRSIKGRKSIKLDLYKQTHCHLLETTFWPIKPLLNQKITSALTNFSSWNIMKSFTTPGLTINT